ncbi:Putative zincin peptidase [Mariniphaga anaerophila]|uniref:Putative zincin peptidase n=1 Tax=Mariniphaga anaerophila TaxID=1484053 RepID=A0A1M5FPY3_9BACT|nr:DUF3267 domain-containing protein [Mariniphaga anaerophila]SHF93610.1 Putative zincin peptidase [Mariniphaga anaerophila]
MANPTNEELQNSEKYELVAQLEHRRIKEFVVEQLNTESSLIKGFMVYQGIMILVGLFFATRPLVLALRGNFEPLFWLLGAMVFSFSLLIVIHELLHLLAFKITGAKKVRIGGDLKKFIFYAEADRHVLNKKQFSFIALTPLVAVKIMALAGIILTISSPAVYFWIFVMCVHSLFCAGDVGMLSFLNRFTDSEIYTFDVSEEKRSYFYREI